MDEDYASLSSGKWQAARSVLDLVRNEAIYYTTGPHCHPDTTLGECETGMMGQDCERA
jgi:hypothetical protein